MSYKILHLADTHIRNLKFHREYREVFTKLFEQAREEKPDFIVHCGDIAHTKTQISPEFVEMAAWFLESLANIAPTYVILGNHDGNLKNSTRQDALTPIVSALGVKDLHLLKDAGETSITDDLTFNVLSVFDEDNWVKPTDKSKINIALYHGAISGIQTDTGYVLEHGEHDLSIFKDFDYAMLGDIHKTNQSVDAEGRVRYPGSTVQQNHGESNDKGYLVWEIEDKEKFSVRHVAIENPSPFVTVELTSKGKIPKNVELKTGSRVRLVGNHSITLAQIRRAVDVAKTRFKPESITYLNKATNNRSGMEDIAEGLEQEDLRDLAVQEELIREFLNDYEADDDVMDKILELNRNYNTLAEQSEETLRNVKWNIKNLQWDNLFNYGESNRINFDALEGVVGIFGKNFSGKSSTVDSLLWAIQNSTSKNVRKNLNIINQNKAAGRAKIELMVGNDMYVIERSAEKYVKKLKGEETEEAKTEVDFTKYDTIQNEKLPAADHGNMNGNTGPETNKNIRKVFGTLDDFLLTSMTSQIGSLSFINEGSTERKKILGKFLDLDMFAKKHKMANDDASDIKGALKRLEGRDFDEEIQQALAEVEQNEKTTEKQKKACESLKAEISSLEQECRTLQGKIDAAQDVEYIDIDEVQKKLKLSVEKKSVLGEELQKNVDSLTGAKQKLEKATSILGKIDIQSVREQGEIFKSLQNELESVAREVRLAKEKEERQLKKVALLDEVPCGTKYPKCKFLLDAHDARTSIEETKELIQLLGKKKSQAEDKLLDIDDDKITSVIENYETILEHKRDVELDISKLEVGIAKGKGEARNIESLVEELEQKIDNFNKNREAAVQLKIDKEKLDEISLGLVSKYDELDDCEEEMLELYKSHGSLEQKLSSLEEQKGELGDLRIQYAAYDLYEKCMHSNGISYDIIKKRLPVINEEIAKVLANVVDFEIFFEDDGKKLDILIKHPKYDPRPLELGSGAEKMLAAMAIRLALIKISSLPQGDLFILDEPATALDEENMEGFIRIIDMLKSQFKTIIVISHLDALKDIVDRQIVIDKTDGFAHVEV